MITHKYKQYVAYNVYYKIKNK